jgi:glycosyltransferase involved in cell wall biosynthesis
MSSLACEAPLSHIRAARFPARALPRVALVAASLDILGGHGIEAALLREGLEADGYDVSFLPVNPRFPRSLAWLRRVPCARTVLNELLYAPTLAALRDADVVHVFSASYWSFLLAAAPPMLAARALGKRVVLHYHSGEAEDHLARWGLWVHPWLRLAHAIVVPSVYLQDVFARHGHRAQVIPNVVDLARFRYRERLPSGPRLLSTRNLESHYGVDTVLKAFSLLKAQHPEASLTVAGSGSQASALHRLARELGLEDVRFVGRVEPEAMPGLCDACDVFVNASVVDNQPVSILEAFAAGLPVATTPTGGIAEMVRHAETGLLVAPRDPLALARAVARLLEQPEHARDMARRARQEVEAYTWPRVRKAWADAYHGEAGCGSRV